MRGKIQTPQMISANELIWLFCHVVYPADILAEVCMLLDQVWYLVCWLMRCVLIHLFELHHDLVAIR